MGGSPPHGVLRNAHAGDPDLFVRGLLRLCKGVSACTPLERTRVRKQTTRIITRAGRSRRRPGCDGRLWELSVVAEESIVISVNRQAYHDYFVDETYEAGIALIGAEVKSIREGHVNLRGAYARVKNDEVWLEGVNIAAYEHAMTHPDPMRPRKLLLHRREIARLLTKTQAKGLTLVPLRLYFSNNHVKVLLGLCRGKKQYDKRDTIRERDMEREMARTVKQRVRG